jgi:hypothetical protein
MYVPAGKNRCSTVKSKGMVASSLLCAEAAVDAIRLAAANSAVAKECFISVISVSSGALFGSPSLLNAEKMDDSRQPYPIYSYHFQLESGRTLQCAQITAK